jgi:hypothetical protein
MKEVSPYSNSFVLTEAVSNNSFNYERRRAYWNKLPLLHVPDLISVEFSELRDRNFCQVEQGTYIVFEDYDGDETFISCKGLKHFIATELPGRRAAPGALRERRAQSLAAPVYIFDNHNHAFYFWQLERLSGTLKNGSLLIHVDQHKDSRVPGTFLSDEGLKSADQIFKYTNTVLNVGNFIPAAQKSGLAGKVINVDSSESLAAIGGDLAALRGDSGECVGRAARTIILDIDLDFFAPELDYINNDLKLAVIKKLLPLANVVTIATSPFFIEQKMAINWLKRIFQ